MSVYENYHTVSNLYDRYRIPIGSKIIEKLLYHQFGGNLDKIKLLDAGCGTGNYSAKLLAAGVGHVTLMDGNPGMLKCSQQKLMAFTEKGRTKFVEHLLPILPFDDNSFDAVTCNFVIHHLDKDRSVTGYPNHQKAIKEFYRVLKPGGICLLNHVQDFQVNAFWVVNLIKDELLNDIMYRTFVSGRRITSWMKESKFEKLESYVPHHEICAIDEYYYNFDGPFSKEWRDGLSFWALIGEEHTAECLERLKKIKTDGKLEEFKEQCADLLHKYGQSTIYFASKPLLQTI